MKWKMGLVGLAALCAAGCISTPAEEAKEPTSNLIADGAGVTAEIPTPAKEAKEPTSNLIVDGAGVTAEVYDWGESNRSYLLKKSIAFTRYPECCDNLKYTEFNKFGLITCIKGGSQFYIINDMGQKLWIRNYEEGKDTIRFDDYDCDWHVDKVYNSRLNRSVNKSSGDEGFFKEADKVFNDALGRIGQDIDLNKAIEDWKKLPKTSGFFDRL